MMEWEKRRENSSFPYAFLWSRFSNINRNEISSLVENNKKVAFIKKEKVWILQ